MTLSRVTYTLYHLPNGPNIKAHGYGDQKECRQQIFLLQIHFKVPGITLYSGPFPVYPD